MDLSAAQLPEAMDASVDQILSDEDLRVIPAAAAFMISLSQSYPCDS